MDPSTTFLDRRSLSGLLGSLLSAVVALTLCPLPSQARPNILLFLVDDLGWHDLGCYGETWIETPRIDRFAQSAVRFSHFYANGPVCSPTRAAIQSGQYPTRFQLTAHIPGHYRPFERITEPPNAMFLPEEVITLGEAMRSVGYRTAYFGKWHLGKAPEHRPSQQGYELAVETRGGHFAPDFRALPRNSPQPEPGTNQTDFITDQCLDFLSNHAGPGNPPFFLTCSHFAVHLPLQARAEMIAKYEAKAKSDPNDVTHPVYAAMVEQVDQSFGRILDRLDQLGVSRNTLVILTSDNGALRSPYHGEGYVVTSNAPLRGEKGSLYEGGVRVPTLIRWPGRSVAGAVCHEPAASIDLYPTFLDAARAASADEQILDGHSLTPLLERPGSRLRRDALFWHYPHYHHSRPASSICTRVWKLIYFWDDGTVELYRISEDPGESNDLAASQGEVVRELLGDMALWRQETGALIPYWNERYQPDRAGEWWNKMTLERIEPSEIRERVRRLPFDGPMPSPEPRPSLEP